MQCGGGGSVGFGGQIRGKIYERLNACKVMPVIESMQLLLYVLFGVASISGSA